jgi:hypothetical protein
MPPSDNISVFLKIFISLSFVAVSAPIAARLEGDERGGIESVEYQPVDGTKGRRVCACVLLPIVL